MLGKAFLHSWKDRSVQMLRLEKERSVIPDRINRDFQFGFPWSVAQNLPHMYRPQIIGSELIRIYEVVFKSVTALNCLGLVNKTGKN